MKDTDTLYDSRLCGREFGSHVLHVASFLEWVKSKGLHLPSSNPPIENYRFAQVEALLCAIERGCNDVTPEQALNEVMTRPDLKSHRLHEDGGDAKFARWQLTAGAHADWQKVIAAAVRSGELVLLDKYSKLPNDGTAIDGGISTNTERRGSGIRWTDDELARLKAYRESHTTPETAEQFGISERRVRDLLASFNETKTPTAHNPWRTKGGRK